MFLLRLQSFIFPLFVFLSFFLSSLYCSIVPIVSSPTSGCFSLSSSNPCSSVLPASSVGYSICVGSDFSSSFVCPFYPFISCSRDAEYITSKFPALWRIIENIQLTVNYSSSCAKSSALLLCSSLYQPCDSLDSPPRLPCSSVFSSYSTTCSHTIAHVITKSFIAFTPSQAENYTQISQLFDSSAYNQSTQCDSSQRKTQAIDSKPASLPLPTCSEFPSSSDSFCSKFIHWPVYLSPGESLQTLESAFQSFQPLFNLVSDYPRGSSSSCLAHVARLLCLTIFPIENFQANSFHKLNMQMK
jgi:hypothetical protein